MAVGAAPLVEAARVYDSVEDAIGPLQLVFAATAATAPWPNRADARRSRASPARGGGARHASASCSAMSAPGSAMTKVALADCIIAVPTDPGFTSLNLGQAVLLIGYEWFRCGDANPSRAHRPWWASPAPREELIRLFEHLEEELERSGFLFPPGNRPGMIRNLRSILHRAN